MFSMIILKSSQEIERIRTAGAVVAGALEELKKRIYPGITTRELDKRAEEFLIKKGGTPAFKGYKGDAAITLPVGRISSQAKHLLEVTEASLYKAIDISVIGKRVSDISNTIQCYVEGAGYSVVRDFVGHGIGRSLHEEPPVPNYGEPGKGPRLKAGMVLAIEPMVNMGGHELIILENGWTTVTKDGSLSAHFEHTVVITENGPLILTML